MLNIIANLPKCQPLQSSTAIVDISQGIDHISPRFDGVAPTAATNSVLFSLSDGKALSMLEMGELMGHQVRKIDYSGISHSQFRHLIGMSVHVATMGFSLMAVLGAMGHGF